MRTLGALIAIIFGGITVFIGTQTLLGFHDPGYLIFLPLLVFNTIMGLLYIITGVLIWRNHPEMLFAVQSIFLLNLAVLVIIGILYLTSSQVAFESVAAMSFRTIIWLVIYGSLWFVKTD